MLKYSSAAFQASFAGNEIKLLIPESPTTLKKTDFNWFQHLLWFWMHRLIQEQDVSMQLPIVVHFEPNTDSWVIGWTLIDAYGYLAEMEPLGINEKVELEGNVYPNPVIDKLTIELKENADKLSIQVYSIDGKLVKSIELYNVNERVEIDLSDLNSGFHVVNLSANQTSKSFKVFIR